MTNQALIKDASSKSNPRLTSSSEQSANSTIRHPLASIIISPFSRVKGFTAGYCGV